VAYESNEKKLENVYSKKVRAGKKRTYFFDVKETRNNGYSLIITESRKRFDDRGYDRSSVFIYPEDINKFAKALSEVIEHIKTEVIPDYNFEEFDNEYYEGGEDEASNLKEMEVDEIHLPNTIVEKKEVPSNKISTSNSEDVDKW
jgi:hypothetical protein